MILQSTPVLFVDQIAPSAAFFEKLGFRQTVEVMHGDAQGFVIMTQQQGEGGDGGVGIMLQTVASAVDGLGGREENYRGHTAHLFMSVADLDAAERALAGEDVNMGRRDTFYGATEIGWTEPGGHQVVLAQFAANSPDEG